MKKILVIVAVLGLIAYFLIANFDSPTLKYSATTSKNVEITAVKRTPTETKISFKVNAVKYKRQGFKIPYKNIYIQNSKGGKELKLLRAENIELGKIYLDTVFEKIKYTLVFPPLNDSVKKFDFIGYNTRIFDVGFEEPKIINKTPNNLLGNWLKTDGTNEWEYGFYNNVIIYKSKLWTHFDLEKEKEFFVLNLKNNTAQEKLYIKVKTKNHLLIGEEQNKLKLYSSHRTSQKNAVYNSLSPTFKFEEGLATYKGYIKGYHPKMKWQITVFVPNAIRNTYDKYPFEIRNNGTFIAKIPMNYPEHTFALLQNSEKTESVFVKVYLEPNKTVMQFIDLAEYTSAYKTLIERNKRERKSLFMGDLAQSNSGLKQLEAIGLPIKTGSDYYDKIASMNPYQFKEYSIKNYKQASEKLELVAAEKSIDKKIIKFKENEIYLKFAENVLSYNLDKQMAEHFKKDKVSNLDLTGKKELKIIKPITAEYYDFLHEKNLNDSTFLAHGPEFYFLLNKIRFNKNLLQFGKFYNSFLEFKKNLKLKKKRTTVKETTLINKLILCKTSEEFRNIKKNNKTTWNSLKNHYGDIMDESMTATLNKNQDQKRAELFGYPNGFVKELIYAQEKSDLIKNSNHPFSRFDIQDINTNLSNSVIKNTILNFNKKLKLKIAHTVLGKDYFIHPTPKVDKSKVFKTILNKYKGKLIFVDVWATWCGPCLAGIEKSKEVKSHVKGKDIVFVYITSKTSPLKVFEALAPGIKGHHYRLNEEEWKYFVNTFDIFSIPRYLFVDKKGNIINDNVKGAFFGELEMLLKEYL